MPRHIIHQSRYLGENLRRLRRSRDWTVERLAEAVGISKGYLSMIESGKRTPHWSLIMRLVHALGSSLCAFFSAAESIDPPEDGIHSRRRDLIIIDGEPPNERGDMEQPATQGYTHILTPYHPDIRSELVEIYLAPHTEWTPNPISFGAQVVCCGLLGRLLLVTAGTEYVMHERESLAYDASTPHSLRNYTDNPSSAMLTITPVAF